MNYAFANINLKNTEDDSWRIVSLTEDERITEEHGTLFCVAELKKGKDEKIQIIEELVEYVHTIFKDQDGLSKTRSEDLLEHLLEEVNRKFISMSAALDFGSFSDLSFIIGIIQNESLVIASYGELEAWLLHPFAKKGDEKSYRWTNILENVHKGNGNPSGKLFDQVIAGELSEKQTFIISTKNIWQVLTQEKFKDLILDNRLRRIKQIIVKTVSILPGNSDLALLIGKNEPVKSKNSAVVSLTPEQDKADTLSEYDEEKRDALTKLFSPDKDRVVTKKDADKQYKGNGKMEKNVSISSHVENKIAKSKGWFSRLSKKSKIIFAIALLLVVGSIQSLVWINSRNQNEKISVQFDERLREIQAIRDDAEAKLIYNDKETARDLINQALQLTYNLPGRYAIEEEQKQELEEELIETLLEIDGLETIQSIQAVFTFLPKASPSIVHTIIALRSGFMLVVTDQTAITAIDVPNQTAITIPFNSIVGTIDDATYDNESKLLYVLTNENKIFEIALASVEYTDSSLPVKELNFSIADIGDPSVITFYANKLYAIDVADRQVKKLELRNNSVSTWLANEQAGLGAIIDIAIDSNVYLATQSTISQYFKGEKTDWKVSGITPPPATIVDIHADSDDEFIYLLDNATSRLIVLNSKGQLFKQFTSPQLISPAAFIINEPTREIYILDGQTIFRIPITWLTDVEG